MGFAIVAFSIFLRFILYPLTRPYMESMKNMKKYSKELDKLKKKHKGDRKMQMSAQADFYKEKGINPSAGCLPYLLQIVVLIAFFGVFSRVLSSSQDAAANFNALVYEPLKFTQNEQINTHFLYLDVTKPDTITGILPFALPGPMLILSALAQFLSAKMAAPYVEVEEKIAKKTKGEADDMAVAMQSSMIYTFPLITLLIGLNFASGLVLYWLVFSGVQVYIQYRSSGWGGLTPWVKKIGLAK
jgi:YidC/Oxa1 family membrane protein insertase